MKELYIGLVLLLLGIFVFTYRPGLRALKPLPERSDKELLLPRFLAPQKFSEIGDGLAAAKTDVCVAESYSAGHRSRARHRDEVTAYLVCYIRQLQDNPRLLCNADKKDELTRYLRGYFKTLADEQELSETPGAQEMLEIERQADSGSDITTGKDNFDPDPRVIEGFTALLKDGTFTKKDDLHALLRPEVPRPVILTLAAVKPAIAVCQ